MRSYIKHIVIFFLLPISLYGQQKEIIRINESFKDLSFIEFVSVLEKDYDLHFFYREEWVKSLRVNLEARSVSISQLMEQLLAPTRLGYVFQPPGTVFLLPDKKFVYDLPNFHLPENEPDTASEENAITRMEHKYLRGRRPDMVATIVVGSKDQAKQGKPAIVTGKLMDDETREPLIGATIYIPALKKGAATDAYGTLTIPLKPAVYPVIFQCIGMAGVKGNLDVRSDGYFSVTMKKRVQAIEEVVIKGEEMVKRGSRLGMESVSVKTMKELPGLMGEKDVMKIAQMLPGIVSVGEGSAGLNVRGGNADQNSFYINEIPVYNNSHLFGFFSSINSDIIENFSVFKGQVPAEYGGRLASVFNVETRKGNKNKFFTQGGVSPVSANAEIEMPLIKEKISMMLSARSSYSDWILGRLKDPDLRNSEASFYDFALALDFDMNEKNRVGIFAYRSKDDFDLSGRTQYEYGNLGASVNYLHRFSPGLKSTVSIIGSRYDFATKEKSSPNTAYDHSYRLNHYELKGSLSWMPGEFHNLKGGANVILYHLDRGTVNPYGSESTRTPVALGKERGLETAFYLDDNINLGPRTTLYAGLRYSLFTEFGPKTVRNYSPGTPFEDQYVSDTKTYAGGEKIASYQRPEFRAGLDFKVWRNSTVKLSATQMTQYLFMLSNTISIAPNDQWKLVDSHIKPPKSVQYAAGFYQQMVKSGLTASVEFYYKKSRDVVEYKDGADFLASPYAETTILQGGQKAYGAEFMFSKETGRLNGWASYTYSRSLVTVDGKQDWSDINHGKTYPSNYDKPHVLNLVLNYRFNRRFSFSSNLAYNTGRPVTMPQGVYYIDDQPFIDYSGRNEYRIPDYFRLDMSLKLEGNLREKKPMHSYWMVSVYNLTGRSNVNSIFFMSEGGYLHGYKYTVIGVPIFTISWNWKLGNYANN